MLSLVVVPSFFLIMDDLSRLLARVFGEMVGKKDEEDLPFSEEELSRIARENNTAVQALEERIAALEGRTDEKPAEAGKGGGKVFRLPPYAAE